ncbi:hypothetical protein BN2537_6519 [Streptomyces venezuelae]|nr:hypothetical protein BN2537_6519 [Streptomyces venezuelae]
MLGRDGGGSRVVARHDCSLLRGFFGVCPVGAATRMLRSCSSGADRTHLIIRC